MIALIFGYGVVLLRGHPRSKGMNAMKFGNRLLIATASALCIMASPVRASSTYLYVADFSHTVLDQFDGQTGALLNRFPVNAAGYVAINHSDNVWANVDTSFWSNTLVSPSGAVLGATSGGPTPGRLQGAVIGPDDNLYVSDHRDNQILEYDGSTGGYIRTFVSSINGPTGLTFGADGNLYAASNNTSSVFEYQGSTGALLSTFVSSGYGALNDPNALEFGPDGNLFVVSTGTQSVKEYDGATGSYLGDFTQGGLLTNSIGMEFGPNGNLFVTSQGPNPGQGGGILEYNGTTGHYMGVFASTSLINPQGIEFTPTPAPVPELPTPLLLSLGVLVSAMTHRFRSGNKALPLGV
jgi:hypothetical protein